MEKKTPVKQMQPNFFKSLKKTADETKLASKEAVEVSREAKTTSLRALNLGECSDDRSNMAATLSCIAIAICLVDGIYHAYLFFLQ